MSTKKLQILGTSLGNNVYTQPEEPTDAPDGSLWVDTDAEAQSNSISIDASLTIEGQAADAKATGDAIRSLSEETDPTVPDWAKQPTKPSYTAEEVGALPINTVIPTVPDNVSAFRNDAGYLTEHQDISGKLDASELPTAINTALAQAKASGEFDGADGIGIQSVEQTTTSTEDGGTNVVTVTRTDGTSSTFQVKNGSRGQDATVDASLTQSGKAADAAVVGQRLSTLSEEIGAVPENVALLEDVTADEASGDFIPMLSPNGTEYRLSIGDDGVPVIKNVNGATVWSGTSGGSSGGDTGGDDTGGGGTDTTWTSGVPYTLTIIADEYINKTSGAFETYAGWSRTDYTTCAGAARIIHTGNKYSSSYCAWYDINKNFISSFGIGLSTAGNPQEIEVPADAAFFAMSTTSESMNALTVTPYET